MLSPALWRKHIKPYSTQLIKPFKEAGCKTMYHSCGSIVPVIPDLIEMGLDILDPIQPKAAGIDPETLKSEFGERLSFHGGLDIQELLPFGTPAQVATETARLIGILGANSGYIVSTAHRIQPDAPVENVLALFKTAAEYKY
jgi:uroporphyrinogen decarboxylase